MFGTKLFLPCEYFFFFLIPHLTELLYHPKNILLHEIFFQNSLFLEVQLSY